MGKLPDYLIIGSTRCGTTSMYSWINAHPDASGAKGTNWREVHFFDYEDNWNKGLDWYANQFHSNHKVTGETSPTYLQHPHVPFRIYKSLSTIKFIVMLRNPVDRAWSDYWLARHKGWISQDFSAWIRKEDDVLAADKKDVGIGEDFNMTGLHLRGFLQRGKYACQLQGWLDLFSHDQFLILKSENVWASPKNAVHKVYDFLNLDADFMPGLKRVWHKSKYNDHPKSADRKWLVNYFVNHNEMLTKMLGDDFTWP